MGFLDKIKKAVSGGSAPAPKTGGQTSGGQGGNRQGGQGGQGGNRQGGQGGQGGNRQGGNRNRGGQGAQGGNRQGGQGQGGNRQGGNRPQGEGQGEGQGGNRRRGSRGGRNRSGGQGSEQQGGQATQDRPQQGEGGAQGGAAGSNASKRRRRGGRGRGSGSSGSGGTRTVTRSDAAELKEQQEKRGEKPQRDRGGRDGSQGGQRKRSRGGRSGGSGSGGNGGGNRRGGRERTRRGSSSSGSQRRVLDANERPKDPVKKQILINAQDPNEIRVAIREQQQVVEVYVERKGKRSLAGNIYKGRVQNVLPGMEACFVDVGLERNGFLYVDEITPAAADSDQIMKVSMVTEVEAGSAESTDPATKAMEAAAAEHDETLEISDAMEEEDREQAEAAAAAAGTEGDKPAAAKAKGRGRSRIQNKRKIQELLKQGQEILVQVVKDPMGTKGSRLTTQYSLAGRYLVYVPDGEGLGVSRRLEDAERNRLREIVKQFELPWGGGLIVRTAAEGARDEDIAKDLDLLLRLHEQLMEKAGDARAPKLLYNEADLSLRIIRDLFNGEVEEVLVDDDRQYQRITNYLKRTSPELAERVRMHDGQRPLFESYGVEDAIKSTLSKRAELPSGGYLILDKTEAFHVIDVNSGRNVGKASLEETITKTNMEAAAEVVRQLRLRDLGGIIVIDFIDMNLMKNRDAVLEHFRTELSKDRTKTYLVEISPLGLVEMTRQNVSEGVREILTSTCRTCEGRGVQVSPETHAIEVERALVDLAAGLGDVEAVAIDAQPDVAKALAGNQGKQVELDKRTGKHVRVLADPDLSPNTFAVRATGTIAEVDAAPEPLVRGSKHKVMIDRVDPVCEADGLATIEGVLVTVIGAGSAVGEERTVAIAACSGSRAFATLVKPARRRRRRGGRGRRKATVGVGADGATTLLDEDGVELEGDDAGDDELEDGDDDEFEDFEEDEAAAVVLDDAPEEFDDERTEIPQRLVMLDEDDAEEVDEEQGDDEQDSDGGDDDDDNDDDDDDDDDDGDRDNSDDSDSDSDSGSDDGDGDADGDDPSGGMTGQADASEDADEHGDDDAEDDLLDPTSISDGNGDDDSRTLVRRDADHADRDEPSIDVDGPDELLEQRGITAAPRRPAREASPRATSASPGGGTADANASGDGDGDSASGEGTGSVGPDGAPRRRRRRGSRGGRGRSRSGTGQSRSDGAGPAGSQSSDGAATSSAPAASGSDGSSDA